jgi:hypothetical protein
MPAILKIHGGHGQVSEGHHDTQRFANPCRQGACDAVIPQDRRCLSRNGVLPCPDNLQALASHCKRYVNREVGSLLTVAPFIGNRVIAITLCRARGWYSTAL